ncbi:MAG: hypothetical protein DI570_15285 [Phenylobacterium zucineum]|nr:MAG: hypothetical protein DI570_15285 [Phenylobacterium zucineum]
MTANFGHPILEATTFSWAQNPKKIRHYILTVEQDVAGLIQFRAVPVLPTQDDAPKLEDMIKYASSKIGMEVPKEFRSSPLDMKVSKQGWLLIQLDPKINWQFTKGELPCTLKVQDIRGRNVMLRHLDSKGNPFEGAVAFDDCRTIFFGVVQRDKPGTGDGSGVSCHVNLNVEFLQIVSGQPSSLKIIIDPDVPNEGPDAIP